MEAHAEIQHEGEVSSEVHWTILKSENISDL